MSLRPKKSEVMTGMPCAAAAASKPCGSSLLQKIFGLFLRGLLALLMFQNRLNGALFFVDRFGVCVLFVVDADDVETVATFNDIAGLALWQ